jgi:glycosyltransferase involved in cell wall biosynthesis
VKSGEIKGRVSFVIPSYNSAAWLPHAVESALGQTHKDIEVLIVDDCSTDTTGEYIAWLKAKGDKRVVYHRNDKNLGRSASRNKGNELATGEYICVLDADDLALNKRAELTIKKLEKCDVCYGSSVFMDAIGYTLKTATAQPIDRDTILKPLDLDKWNNDLKAGIAPDLKETSIVHSSMGLRRETAIKYPYADGKVATLGIDDWAFQISMLRDGLKFGVIPDVICAWRYMPGTISHTRNAVEVIKTKAEILNTGVRA